MAIAQLLLDTNIFVHYVRDDVVWSRIREQFNPWIVEPKPLYCVVSVGELRSFALQRHWGAMKREQLTFALSQCEQIGIDEEAVLDAYARIDSDCVGRGLVLGKNDLWIAAVAHVTRSILVSNDRDFLPLSPTYFDFELIDTGKA